MWYNSGIFVRIKEKKSDWTHNTRGTVHESFLIKRKSNIIYITMNFLKWIYLFTLMKKKSLVKTGIKIWQKTPIKIFHLYNF